MPSVSTSFVLASPGTPTSEAVTACKDRDERVFDDLFLAEDDRGDGFARLADLFDRGFGGMHDGGIETGGVRELSAHGVTPSCFHGPCGLSMFRPAALPVYETLVMMHNPGMHHSCQSSPNSTSVPRTRLGLKPGIPLIRGLLHTISWVASSQPAWPPGIRSSLHGQTRPDRVRCLGRNSGGRFADRADSIGARKAAYRELDPPVVEFPPPFDLGHVGSLRKAVEPLPCLLARLLARHGERIALPAPAGRWRCLLRMASCRKPVRNVRRTQRLSAHQKCLTPRAEILEFQAS